MRGKISKRGERGATLVEFAIGATVFLTAVFAVLEFGVLLWTHNALTDAARRGVRYAVNQPTSSSADVKNVVVYGDPKGGTQPLVKGLQTSNVNVVFSPDYGLGAGTVSVSITNYDFNFVVPMLGKKIRMPAYNTTLTGENAGLVPPNI